MQEVTPRLAGEPLRDFVIRRRAERLAIAQSKMGPVRPIGRDYAPDTSSPRDAFGELIGKDVR